MLEHLRKDPMRVSLTLLDQIESQLGNERFRPEEVVSTVYANSFPATFAEIVGWAAEVLNILYGKPSRIPTVSSRV
jgi:hypothetical protein